MRIPNWLVVMAALVAAIPFGWYLGVYAAVLLLGPDIGVFPVVSIPLAILASGFFVLVSSLRPWQRLAIMAGGSGFMALVSLFVPA
jgi:hypothetical protein